MASSEFIKYKYGMKLLVASLIMDRPGTDQEKNQEQTQLWILVLNSKVPTNNTRV